MARPPAQRHTIKLELPKGVESEDLQRMLVLHEGTSVAKAYLSTNVGASAVTLAAIVAFLSFPPTQRMVTAFLAFIRTQIAAIAHDIQQAVIPTPREVVDTIATGAEEVAKTAKDVWDDINRRLNQELERRGLIEEGADPGGTLLGALQELFDRLINDPLFGVGGGGRPIIPGR